MLTNSGKVFCYINNFNDEENISSDGKTDRCYIIVPGSYQPEGRNASNNVYLYKGNHHGNPSYSDYDNYCMRQACHGLIILLTNYEEKQPANRYFNQDGEVIYNLSTIFEGSYNNDHDDVSYINPIIMHATKTVKNNTQNDIVVRTVELWTYKFHWGAMPKGYGDDSGGSVTHTWTKLASELLDTPVTLAPGDTATFTITVK